MAWLSKVSFISDDGTLFFFSVIDYETCPDVSTAQEDKGALDQ